MLTSGTAARQALLTGCLTDDAEVIACRPKLPYLQCGHMTTKTRIVRIGNSRGIRVPKVLLDEAQLPDEVELHAEPGRLVVQGARRPRMGWADAARAMSKHGHDGRLDEPTATRFDQEEWDW